jgi:uncharacterized LabA/DUF88 family protein
MVASRYGKIALFIDSANLHSAAMLLGFDIDFRRLFAEFQKNGDVVRASYYTPIPASGEFSPIKPLLDWLDYNGYTVVTNAAKQFGDGSDRRTVKGNVAIELVIDAIELAEHVDQIVLFSGDGNFCRLVEALQRRGVRVTVVSSISARVPLIAEELRRQADEFIDLLALKQKIGREKSEPKTKPPAGI